jgi:hypothetical protein
MLFVASETEANVVVSEPVALLTLLQGYEPPPSAAVPAYCGPCDAARAESTQPPPVSIQRVETAIDNQQANARCTRGKAHTAPALPTPIAYRLTRSRKNLDMVLPVNIADLATRGGPTALDIYTLHSISTQN